MYMKGFATPEMAKSLPLFLGKLLLTCSDVQEIWREYQLCKKYILRGKRNTTSEVLHPQMMHFFCSSVHTYCYSMLDSQLLSVFSTHCYAQFTTYTNKAFLEICCHNNLCLLLLGSQTKCISRGVALKSDERILNKYSPIFFIHEKYDRYVNTEKPVQVHTHLWLTMESDSNNIIVFQPVIVFLTDLWPLNYDLSLSC